MRGFNNEGSVEKRFHEVRIGFARGASAVLTSARVIVNEMPG